MNQDNEYYHKPKSKLSWWKTPFGMVCIFFFIVAVYFLFMEHRAHIGGNWIYLILLACPLMHIFMHGGHGGHNHFDNKADKDKEDKEDKGEK